jgi:hypothetical protein
LFCKKRWDRCVYQSSFGPAYHGYLTVSLNPSSARNEPMKLDLWFPMRSAVVFFSALVAVNRPSFIPALTFYLIAAAMFSISYQRSKNPSPWKRCQVCSKCAILFCVRMHLLSNTVYCNYPL